MRNDILNMKGDFEQKSNVGRPGSPTLPSNTTVSVKDLQQHIYYLNEMAKYWKRENLLNGCLVSVYYTRVIPKSKRTNSFLKYKSNNANDTIVGTKFSSDKNKHIITHFIPYDAISHSILIATMSAKILLNEFNGSINDLVFNNQENFSKIDFKKYNISKSVFQRVIQDTPFIEKFDVEKANFDTKHSSIVTLYDTGENTVELLKKYNINVLNERVINKTTVLLDQHYLNVLLQKAPYLVVMAVENISDLSSSDFSKPFEVDENIIPSPRNEPTIGVIDTLFDTRVYFHEWVDFHNMVDPHIPVNAGDYKHGTAVSSIVVDGPSINPELDDGCGRFKVRHFGVAINKAFNSFTIIRAIKEIVADNPDIKVWNLSLGSNEEIRENFISAEASILDQIQYEHDIIFVIAGTNNLEKNTSKRIGSPADSINSLVVNSVDSNKNPADYSREGIVLSFFTKPDVSYYGGGNGKLMYVCEPLGKASVAGTSFAAPWISRKLSYLIDIIGLSREVAKALIVDSAIGWENSDDKSLKGHGVVPIKIKDVIQSSSDEIKFVVEGISEGYDTYNYNFPVPIYQDKHPYIVKATLCYFPKCSRNQGVDYTNTELDIQFGRISNDGKLKTINNNKQGLEEKYYYLHEDNARKLFGKWENVKHICESMPKNKTKGKKVYNNPMWGMSIKTKERLNKKDGEKIRFGVVVTLKEINGVNRIDDFIQQCSFKGWLVNRINVENRIDIYQTSEQEIHLE
ncbi:S8 family peptidase [Mycoplasma sp. P36-A1]|uniref:S8 family peptidase n=1 Tax=Mycoplasma sp. P36-A1 TaxID=3252900 RepID=UPI003C2D6CCD